MDHNNDPGGHDQVTLADLTASPPTGIAGHSTLWNDGGVPQWQIGTGSPAAIPLLGGGGQLDESLIPKADQPEAEAGVDNDVFMTPLRTAQAIAAQVDETRTELLDIEEFTSGGTWNKPAGLRYVVVHVIGGGGGGRGATGNGGTGGTSSFGAFLSASGGSGGTSMNGGAGGTGSGGDINLSGGRGRRARSGGSDDEGPGGNGAGPFGGQGGAGSPLTGTVAGGGGGTDAGSSNRGGGGGGGYSMERIAEASLGATVAVTVGSGGSAGSGGGSGAGAAGRVYVFEYGSVTL